MSACSLFVLNIYNLEFLDTALFREQFLKQTYVLMARTKASVGAKVSMGKSSKARCSAAPPPSSSSGSGSSERSSRSTGGGNPVCPRETPRWQRSITNFFITKPSDKAENEDTETAGSSKPKPKRNIIESDDEEQETPKNTELDETIELETLTGEDSHKIEEYYPKNGDKGKGVGKKTKIKDKENVSANIERNNKRERDESLEENVSKKVKI